MQLRVSGYYLVPFAMQRLVRCLFRAKWLPPLLVTAIAMALCSTSSRALNHLSSSPPIDERNSSACYATVHSTPYLLHSSRGRLAEMREDRRAHQRLASATSSPRCSVTVVVTAADFPLASSYRPSTSTLEFVEILVARSSLGSYYGILRVVVVVIIIIIITTRLLLLLRLLILS